MKMWDCKSVIASMDAWLDGLLSNEDSEGIRRHIESCDACRSEMEWRRSILEICAELDMDTIQPEECRQAWRQAVRESAIRPQKRFSVPRWAMSIAACLAVIVGVTAVMRHSDGDLFSASKSNIAYFEDDGYDSNYESGYATDGFSTNAATTRATGYLLSSDGEFDQITEGSYSRQEQKVIRSARRSIETSAYDADLACLDDLVAEYNAYYEEKQEYGQPLSEKGQGRSMEGTIRVPTSSLDNFLTSLVAVGVTVQSSENAADISDTYYDSATRLSSLRTQLQRLQDMFASAENVEDMLSIESYIQEVQYEIESLEGKLRGWDSKISYSTVAITLKETEEKNQFIVMETTLKDRISEGFHDSVNALMSFLQNVAVAMAVIAPQLVIWIPAVLILYLIYRLIRRAIRKRRS